MKHLKKIKIAVAILGILILAGCGHRVGNDTLGATGGGENGYGYLSISYGDTIGVANTSSSPQIEQTPAVSDAAR